MNKIVTAKNLQSFSCAETQDGLPRYSALITWLVLAMIFYFAISGQSPFANSPVELRLVQSAGASGDAIWLRIASYLLYLVCGVALLFKGPRLLREYVGLWPLWGLTVLAFFSAVWSQNSLITLAQTLILFGTSTLALYFACKFSAEEQMWLMMTVGAVCALASMFFAIAMPQYGLDHLGGHNDAWKGIYPSKNTCGERSLLFLLPAFYITPGTLLKKLCVVVYIVLLLFVIAMSRATTAWVLTAGFVLLAFLLRSARRFNARDLLSLAALVAISCTVVLLALSGRYKLLLDLVGKDSTLTGRLPIWAAVMASILRRPFLGYGFQAFWSGLHGESARVILSPTVHWLLAQPQNGFLDVWLQLGIGGLILTIAALCLAGKSGIVCFWRCHDQASHWYLSIVVFTVVYNLVEAYFLNSRDLTWLLFICAYRQLQAGRRRRLSRSESSISVIRQVARSSVSMPTRSPRDLTDALSET